MPPFNFLRFTKITLFNCLFILCSSETRWGVSSRSAYLDCFVSYTEFLQFSLCSCWVKLPWQLLPSKFLNIWTSVKDLFFRCYFWKPQIVMCQSQFNWCRKLKAHILRKYLAWCTRLWRMKILYHKNFWNIFFFYSGTKIKSLKHLHRKGNTWKYLPLAPKPN